MRRISPIFTALALLSCAGWLAACAKDTGTYVPDKNKRIAILTSGEQLAPDLNPQAITLPEASVNMLWPQAGGTSTHVMQHPDFGKNPEILWKTSIGKAPDVDGLALVSPVLISNTLVTMDANARVKGINAETGDVLWESKLLPDNEDGGTITGGLAHDGKHVYVTTSFAQVFALDAATGNMVWQKALPSPIRAAPTLRDSRLYILTVDNELHALDTNSGATLWYSAGLSETTTIVGGASPAVSNGLVVAPYSSGELVGLLSDNGRTVWTDSLSGVNRYSSIATLSDITALPLIDTGIVYAIGHGGRMVAINARSGKRLWMRSIGGLNTPWLAGDNLFVISSSNALIAISRTGKINWVSQLPSYEDVEDQEDPILWTGPILAGGTLYAASNRGQLAGFSPVNGKMTGSLQLPDGVSTPAIIANKTLYFITNDADVVAVR